MTKKKTDISDYCTAGEASRILSAKYGHFISPQSIYRVRGVESVLLHKTARLYKRSDIQTATIRQRKMPNL